MANIQPPASHIRIRTIYPVVLAVPQKDRRRSGREKVSTLSRLARRAIEISAQKSNIDLKELQKNKNGVPLPFNGNYWSLSHKPQYVAGVVADTRIGIDIEAIRPCSDALFRKTADEIEWGLTDTDRFTLFFRYWTAKESVLKAVGTGIKDLKSCRVKQIIDEHHLIINYQEELWHVEHSFFDGHIASVVKNDFDVLWTILT
jgi:4'-phosphopantetheinyl transferase